MTGYPLYMIILGLVLIFVCLGVFLLKENTTPQQEWVIRVLVSLGAGFVAGGILGTFEIQGSTLGLTVKAGGPVAVTVFFYWVNPPKAVRALRARR